MLIKVCQIVLLISVTFKSSQEQSNQNETKESQMSERLAYGMKMLSYMDTSVNPCNDFYKFSCGNYFKVNKVKQRLKNTGIFRSVKENIIEEMHDVLTQEPANNMEENEMFRKTRAIYQACMKENLFEFPKSEVYLKLIESLGGWPVLNSSWNSEDFDWFEVITKIKTYGVDIIFKETVSGSAIGIEPDEFGLYFKFNERNINKPTSRSFQVNKKLAIKIMTMYGVNSTAAKRAFDEIIEFGKEVLNAEKASNVYGVRITKYPIQSLNSFAPLTYDWQNYFKGIIGENANNSIQILVKSEDYLQYIPMAFRQKFIRGAANYIFLKLLYNLHHELRFPKYQQRYCFLYTEKHMEPFMTVFYIRSRYHRKSNMNEILRMMSYIQNALKDTMKSSDWMDEATKEKAFAKLDMMQILFTDDDCYSVDMNEIHRKCCQDLEVTPDDHYGNVLKMQNLQQKIDHRYFFSELDTEVTDIRLLPLKVNAFYSAKNKVFIFPGIMRMPFYNHKLPMAYNFASIGRLLGHEITHGFDNDGRKLDEMGQNIDWWSPQSASRFEKLAECFIEQYQKLWIPEINGFVDGVKTLAENIADNGGLRQAYIGYQKWLTDHPEELQNEYLPGFNFTSAQLFFISYGQSFCEHFDWLEHKSSIDDEHAPNKFRLIGTIQNFDKFSEQFRCNVGTPMNPLKKCILW